MTFAFGMNQRFQDAYRNGNAKLRYALMESMSGPTRTKEQRLANEAVIISLRRMRENKYAIGSRLDKGAFNHWLVEQLSGLNVHVRYLHTKYMLVDPLGTNPLVVSGSANFSEASTTDNAENMLIIRGNPRVADIYLGEFMRLYRHFAFRDWLTQHPEADQVTRLINRGSATSVTASSPDNAATLRVTSAVRKILICDDMPQVLRRYWIVLQTVAYVYRVADIEVTHFLQVLNRFVTIGL